MNVKLVQIGNSQGIRIPRSILNQLPATSEYKLSINNDTIQLTPQKKHPREGWEKAFSKSTPVTLAFSESTNDFDHEEWTW